MNIIIELIDIRNRNNKLLDMFDIENIINELVNYFDIETLKVTNKTNKYLMSLSLRNLELVVDYERLKVSNDVVYTNYVIMFAIIHELRHYWQINFDVGKVTQVYNECFQYINSSSLFKNAFYARFHDYFPIEVNANIVGFLYVLYIQKKLDDQVYYEVFKNMLMDVINKRDIGKTQDVLVSILGNDYLKLLSGLTEYDLFINGFMNNEEKSQEMLKMLLL